MREKAFSFPNAASEFVYYRTYSRWRDDLGRRENWPETVERVVSFLQRERGEKVPEKVFKKIREYMLNLEVLPSMRLVWSAGEAAKKNNLAIYNCSFAVIDDPIIFSEALYILMHGTGLGFSVEQEYIEKLPMVPIWNYQFKEYTIEDSREGWADSVRVQLENLYNGYRTLFDYKKIRPKGARLKTMGGRSSGPVPLAILHSLINDIFAVAQGRKLLSIECHDIMCQIAETVILGGVRRSALISLSNLHDDLLRDAKVWPFPVRRSCANNSAVYKTKPSAVEFLKEWAALASSGTGERGIVNLGSARKRAPKRRKAELIQGTNPCGEVVLRGSSVEGGGGFCNLSTVVVRPDDDLDDLMHKVETAVWVGAIQSTFTDFGALRPGWKKNAEDERLLGVSLSGQMDCPDLITEDNLKALKSKAIKTAKRVSEALDINMPASITVTKPEGTTSQLVFSGSGLHTWYDRFFIRRYRISSNDPLFRMLKDQNYSMVPEVGQTPEFASTWVLPFPCRAPDGAKVRGDMTAIQQLEHYKKVQVNWCEMNASNTVYVRDDEWFDVGNWVYQNWDIVCGVSFLPFDGGRYELAPYESITEEQYNEMIATLPKIDYSLLPKYEVEDNTEGAKTYACTGNACELV